MNKDLLQELVSNELNRLQPALKRAANDYEVCLAALEKATRESNELTEKVKDLLGLLDGDV